MEPLQVLSAASVDHNDDTVVEDANENYDVGSPQNNNINTQTQLLQTQLAFVLFANWQLQTQLAVARNENWQLRAQLGFVQYCNQNAYCVPTVQPKNNNHIQTDNWVIAVATAASPAADTLDGQLRDRLQAIGTSY